MPKRKKNKRSSALVGTANDTPASSSEAAQPVGAARSPFVLRVADDALFGEIPRDVADGWEWATRCNAAAPYVSQSPDGQRRFAHQVDQRLRMLAPFEHRIEPAWGLDMTYVRWRREVKYVCELALLLTKPELESAPLVCTDLVHFPPPQSSDRRFLSYMDKDRARAGLIDKEWTMPLSLRNHERRERHRMGHLVPGHCFESVCVNRRMFSRRYVPLPDWWRDVEVPYNMRPELPPVVAYLGRRLMSTPAHPAWGVVRSEWAVSVAMDLMIQARAGRLYWIPPKVRDDLQDLQIGEIFGLSDDDYRADLAILLKLVDELRWSECPSENRVSVPDEAGYTPVYVAGDYFPFDAESWDVLVDPELRIPRDEDGMLTERMDQRGRLVGASAYRLPSESHPQGHARGRNAVRPTASQKMSGQAYFMLNADRDREGGSGGSGDQAAGASAEAETPAGDAMEVDNDDAAPAPPVIEDRDPDDGWSRVVEAPAAAVRDKVSEAEKVRAAQPLARVERETEERLIPLAEQPVSELARDWPAIPRRATISDGTRKITIGIKRGIPLRSVPAPAPSDAAPASSSQAITVIDLTGDDGAAASSAAVPPPVTIEAKKEVAMARVFVSEDGERMVEDTEEYELEDE